MNQKVNWDPSLVKKFGSSNHFKLMNQLRNEVKKYPLTKKNDKQNLLNSENVPKLQANTNLSNLKASQVNHNLTTNVDKLQKEQTTIYKSTHNAFNDSNYTSSDLSNIIDNDSSIKSAYPFDSNRDKSNISFNNSKNFSIHNLNKDKELTNKSPNQIQSNNVDTSHKEENSATFKDRLDKIDMK